MFSKPTAALLLTLTSLTQLITATPVPFPQQATPVKCNDVHIIAIRGSLEPYPGLQIVQINAICKGLRSCGYEDVVYPASFDPAEYCNSASTGVKAGLAAINSYVKRCPKSKVVLTGFSQGGHIVGDILGGAGRVVEPLVGCHPQEKFQGLSRKGFPGKNIRAAVTLGDSRHTAGQKYNRGTGANANGMWGRTGADLAALNKWSDALQTWCDAGDVFCAGGNVEEVHTTVYFTDELAQEVATWVRSKLF